MFWGELTRWVRRLQELSQCHVSSPRICLAFDATCGFALYASCARLRNWNAVLTPCSAEPCTYATITLLDASITHRACKLTHSSATASTWTSDGQKMALYLQGNAYSLHMCVQYLPQVEEKHVNCVILHGLCRVQMTE